MYAREKVTFTSLKVTFTSLKVTFSSVMVTFRKLKVTSTTPKGPPLWIRCSLR